MTTETHTLVLHRGPMKRARDDSVNIDKLLLSVNQQGTAISGWKIEANPIAENGEAWSRVQTSEGWIYSMFLKVVFSHETKLPSESQYKTILFTISKRAAGNNFGRWTLDTVDGEDYVQPHESELFVSIKGESVEYAPFEMPDDFETNFDHLYGLDDPIAQLKSALEAGIASEWENRFNCALIGPPGCGKTDIMKTLQRIFGEDAVMMLDATATTSAGAIEALRDMDVLPRIILMEELEKSTEQATQWLLGVLDQRAEIRKNTARAKIEQETKLFGICTVNDKDVFEKMHKGALSSRFTHAIYFKRPTREQLGMILLREIEKVEGDPAWIRPTLDYCDRAINKEGELGITDPRQVIAYCLSGGDKWLKEVDGVPEYARMLNNNAGRPVIIEDWSRE